VVAVVIPTLACGDVLLECLEGLRRQTRTDFETIIVDNSGSGQARRLESTSPPVRVIANERNVGFGAAINQGCRASAAEYIAALNDDAVPCPAWLDQLVAAMESSPRVGMCASRVLLLQAGKGLAPVSPDPPFGAEWTQVPVPVCPSGQQFLDSAGMLIAADASSKQRGHGEPPSAYDQPADVLLPSGSAALYRRAMLDQIGGFAEEFFLYCEDTDLGLRGRWAGWECRYAPGAIVEHRYSHTSGRVSALKAYLVERNRLFMAVRNLPLLNLLAVPAASVVRYAWHFWYLLTGHGAAAEFAGGGGAWRLPWYVLRAWASLLLRLPSLLAERRAIRRSASLAASEFRRLLRRHSISLRQVASL
jgi:GT2 family glycosyltransferase